MSVDERMWDFVAGKCLSVENVWRRLSKSRCERKEETEKKLKNHSRHFIKLWCAGRITGQKMRLLEKI